MDEAEMQAECGPWKYFATQYFESSSSYEAVDTSAFNFNLADITNMYLNIRSYDKN